jgi:hypothetical protein
MDDLVPTAQERLGLAEEEPSESNGTAGVSSEGPAYADARAVTDHMLSHYAKYEFVVGPTVHAALVDALLSTTFQHLAQTLADAAAPTGVILHFRRQWQCFHRPPEETSYGPAMGRGFCEALVQPTFGAAVALLVDTLNVSDDVLDALVIVWRKQRGVRVSEPGTSVDAFSYCLTDSFQGTAVCLQLLKQWAAWPFLNKSVVCRLG